MGDEAAFSITYTDGEAETATYITRDGSAKATYPNGSSYEGSFHEKKKHGQGLYIWTDGEEEGKEICRYSGAYDNGKRQGLGKMTFPDGSYYHGMWEDNKRCGEGTYKYVNGDAYSGTWAEDFKSGNGAYEFSSDKSQFVGVWESGKITSGKWVFIDGGSYSGRFIDGQPVGDGAFVFSNGEEVTHTQEGVFELKSTGEDDAVKELTWKGGVVCS